MQPRTCHCLQAANYTLAPKAAAANARINIAHVDRHRESSVQNLILSTQIQSTVKARRLHACMRMPTGPQTNSHEVLTMVATDMHAGAEVFNPIPVLKRCNRPSCSLMSSPSCPGCRSLCVPSIHLFLSIRNDGSTCNKQHSDSYKACPSDCSASNEEWLVLVHQKC